MDNVEAQTVESPSNRHNAPSYRAQTKGGEGHLGLRVIQERKYLQRKSEWSAGVWGEVWR